MRRLRWGVVAVVSVTALSLVACGGGGEAAAPAGSVTVADSAVSADPVTVADRTGPTDAVTAAFEAAESGGLPKRIELFACLLGGEGSGQFSGLVGSLSTLALAASGIEPDEFFAAFRTSLEDFEAAETSRSGNRAVVHVSVKVTLVPDLEALRNLMKRNAADRGTSDDATIDTAIDAALGGLLQLPFEAVLEHDVSVVKADGKWHACAP
jgi:hypothetical protein